MDTAGSMEGYLCRYDEVEECDLRDRDQVNILMLKYYLRFGFSDVPVGLLVRCLESIRRDLLCAECRSCERLFKEVEGRRG